MPSDRESFRARELCLEERRHLLNSASASGEFREGGIERTNLSERKLARFRQLYDIQANVGSLEVPEELEFFCL
jgi:hypothetical protein